MSIDSDWDDLMVSLGLEPSTPRVSPLYLLAHPPVPCGTVPGYNRHNTNGETPCQACKDARNAAQNARRAAKRPPKPVSLKKKKPSRTAPKRKGAPPAPREHGTPRGARQHWKYREPVCDACRDAYNAWQNAHRTSDQARTLRLPDDRRRQVESLLRAGHSDWSVHRQTGAARTTIARHRKELGLSGYRTTPNSPACKNGHPFPENSMRDANGWLRCRACTRASNNASKRQTYVPAQPDEIAIERAAAGDPPERLTPRERRAAIAQLDRRQLSAAAIAELVGCSRRTVHRARSKAAA